MFRPSLALIAVLAAACSTSGTRFEPDDVPRIRRGVTTQVEVKAIFGEPTTLRVDASGKAVYVYEYTERKTADTGFLVRIANFFVRLFGGRGVWAPVSVRHSTATRHVLRVNFDSEGVTTNYIYERTVTPTTGVY